MIKMILTILFGLAPLALSCRSDSINNLWQTQKFRYQQSEQDQQNIPPKIESAWQNATEFRLRPQLAASFKSIWVAIDLPDEPTQDYIYLRFCQNLVQVYQDNTLIKRLAHSREERSNSPLFYTTPFFQLPHQNRPSILYMQIDTSKQVASSLSCFDLKNTNLHGSIALLLRSEAEGFLAGGIVFIIGCASLILYLAKRFHPLLYFCLFSMAAGLIYLLGTGFGQAIFYNLDFIQPIWTLCVLCVSVPFFIFVEKILPTHFAILRRIGWLNFCIMIASVLLWILYRELDLYLFVRYYFIILFVEIVVLIPLSIAGIFKKSHYSRRIGSIILLFSIAAGFDILKLLNQENGPIFLVPIALIAFICTSLLTFIEIFIQRESKLEQSKSKMIQLGNQNLQVELDKKTSAISHRCKELAEIKIELEDQHSLLASQKEIVNKVAKEKDVILERIFSLKMNLLPSIFESLHQLHLNFDEDTLFILEVQIEQLSKVLAPTALEYEKSMLIGYRRLLILDSNPKNQRTYRLAIGGSKIDMLIAESEISMQEALDNQGFDLIALTESCPLPILKLVKSLMPEKIIVISKKDSRDNLLLLKDNPEFLQIIPLDLPKITLHKLILAHISKILSHDYIGIEKYLTWGHEIKEQLISPESKPQQIIEVVLADLEKMGLDLKGHKQVAKIAENCLILAQSEAGFLNQRLGSHESQLCRLRYGFDSSFIAISIDLNGKPTSRAAILEVIELNSTSNGPLKPIAELLQLTDALIINSHGLTEHELLLLLYLEPHPDNKRPAAFFHF